MNIRIKFDQNTFARKASEAFDSFIREIHSSKITNADKTKVIEDIEKTKEYIISKGGKKMTLIEIFSILNINSVNSGSSVTFMSSGNLKTQPLKEFLENRVTSIYETQILPVKRTLMSEKKKEQRKVNNIKNAKERRIKAKRPDIKSWRNPNIEAKEKKLNLKKDV